MAKSINHKVIAQQLKTIARLEKHLDAEKKQSKSSDDDVKKPKSDTSKKDDDKTSDARDDDARVSDDDAQQQQPPTPPHNPLLAIKKPKPNASDTEIEDTRTYTLDINPTKDDYIKYLQFSFDEEHSVAFRAIKSLLSERS